jgi:hypothetical protein
MESSEIHTGKRRIPDTRALYSSARAYECSFLIT